MIPILKTIEEVATDIQKIDRNILAELTVTTFDEIDKGFSLLSKLKSQPNCGLSEDKINKMYLNLLKALEKKVDLTTYVMSIPQVEEEKSPARKKDTQAKINFPEKGKVVDHPAKLLQGYERKTIFGTSIEMPKETQELIPLADTIDKINEISFILIKQDRVEDALNLSIDLFEKYNLGDREKAEKNFLFKVLSTIKGIKVDNPEEKSIENLTLKKWIEYFDDLTELMKSKSDSVNLIVAEARESSKNSEGKEFHMTIKAQIELGKYRQERVNENDILDIVSKELKISVDDLIWDAVNDTDEKTLKQIRKRVFNINQIEDAKIVMNLADFKNTILEKMKKLSESGGAKEVYDYFKKNVKNITDYEHKNDETKVKELWEALRNTHKQQKEEEKEKVVSEAENKAIEEETKSKTKKEEFEDKIKEIIASEDPKGMNKAREIYKSMKKDLKKENISVDKLYNEILAEYRKTHPTTDKKVEESNKEVKQVNNIPLPKKIDIEKEYPEIWKKAIENKDLASFTKFFEESILSESKDIKSISGTTSTNHFITICLTSQYMKSIPECKDWDDKQVFKWITDTKNRVKSMKSPNVKSVESSGTLKTEGSTEKKDGKVGEVSASVDATQQNATGDTVMNKNVQQKTAGTTVQQNSVSTAKQTNKKEDVKNSGKSVETENASITNKNDVKNQTGNLNKNVNSGSKKENVTPTNTLNQKEQLEKSQQFSTTSQDKKEGEPGEVIVNAATETASITQKKDSVQSSQNSTDQNIASTGKESAPTISSTEKKDVKDVFTIAKDGDPKLGEDKNASTQKKNASQDVSKEKNGQVPITSSTATNVDTTNKKEGGSGEANAENGITTAGTTAKDQNNANSSKVGEANAADTAHTKSVDAASTESSHTMEESAKKESTQTADGKNQNASGKAASGESAKMNGDESGQSQSDNIHKILAPILGELSKGNKRTKEINELIKKAIEDGTSTLTFREKINVIVTYLRKHRNWDNCPEREINNHVASIISKTVIKDTEEAKTFITEVETARKLAIEEAKKNKK